MNGLGKGLVLAVLLGCATGGLVAACGGGGKSVKPEAGPLTPAEIAERSLPSVVLIQAGDQLGTGFVIWQDGRIATNLHVILGAPSIMVKLPDGREFGRGEVLAVDDRHDLAVLRVPTRNLRALPLGDSDKLKVGERVVAIGHPLGLGDTVSDGLVSAIREVDPAFKVIQISAPIAQGSSGGPLLSDRGEVVGISFMVSREGQNLNFAVPVNYLKPMLLSDKGIAFEEWSRRTQAALAKQREESSGGGGGKIARAVPQHPVNLLDDCKTDELKALVTGISDAITAGAPLYNQGNHEACFRIYEGTALQLEGSLKDCKQVKKALADGRSRASGLSDVTAKAWAMRDAFDGLLDVVARKISP